MATNGRFRTTALLVVYPKYVHIDHGQATCLHLQQLDLDVGGAPKPHQSPHFARSKAADETELLVQVWSVLVFQLVLNLAETFVAIFIGTNIFLFHPTVSIIICLNVLLVEFELMALCALFSIQLNCNTVVRSQTPLCFGRQRIENNDVVLGVRSASSS